MADPRGHDTPIFEIYGVDLVFSGRNHNYERSFPLLGHRDTSDTWLPSMCTDSGNGRIDGDSAYRRTGTMDGVIYVVAGFGSKAHKYPVNHLANYYSIVEPGSVVLDFDGGNLTVTFRPSYTSDRRDLSIVASFKVPSCRNDWITPQSHSLLRRRRERSEMQYSRMNSANRFSLVSPVLMISISKTERMGLIRMTNKPMVRQSTVGHCQ